MGRLRFTKEQREALLDVFESSGLIVENRRRLTIDPRDYLEDVLSRLPGI
jgi:hypothetical protein